MYKDKGKRKESDKNRQRRYREKRKGVTDEGVTDEGVTSLDKPGVYPHVVHALTDPEKRKKLEAIHQALTYRPQLHLDKEVRYGIDDPTFEGVGMLLDITK